MPRPISTTRPCSVRLPRCCLPSDGSDAVLTDNVVLVRATDHGEQHRRTAAQSCFPRCRARHALPARHQGSGQGNAAGVDRPLIQYAVDEAVDAGADTLIFVTNRYKHAIADYFDKAYELEAKLAESADNCWPWCRRFSQSTCVVS